MKMSHVVLNLAATVLKYVFRLAFGNCAVNFYLKR